MTRRLQVDDFFDLLMNKDEVVTSDSELKPSADEQLLKVFEIDIGI